MTTYAMIDLETTDTTARTCILSAGIVFFQIGKNGEMANAKSVYVTPVLQPQLDAGRRISASTLNFWMQQESEAKKAVFNEEAKDSISFTIARLRELDSADVVMAHDIDLDLGAIIDFYTQFAESYDTNPLFHYKKKRDFRS